MLLASSAGRSLQLASVASRRLALAGGQGVDRKTLSRVCRMAEEALGLRAGVRLVLSELVANWGEQAWDRLLVWPSNEHLMRRTGLSERALRDAFRKLVALGLVVTKGSPNGKRYAVRNAEGAVVDAYGFDLTPLYARKETWATLLAEKRAQRQRIKHTYDEITVARRACEEALAELDGVQALAARYTVLVQRTPRRSSKAPPPDLLDAWLRLRTDCENGLFDAANDGENCRHIESNHESSGKACNSGEVERQTVQSSRVRIGRGVAPVRRGADRNNGPIAEGEASLSIGALKDACPDALAYVKRVDTPHDVVAAGRQMRAMLGAGEIVWAEAQQSLGPLRAAIAVILVVQLYEDDAARHGGESRIRNPGGYLRAFVRLVRKGRIDLAAELRTMQRRRLNARRG